MPLLLGLDIGTTSIKAVVYDCQKGRILRTAARPTPLHHPREGWSEHDPEALWQAAAAVIRESVQGAPITGLAISSMAEAGVLVDQKGQAISPIIAWFDRRTEPQAAWVEQVVPMADLYRITGQRASPSFGVVKLLWLRENMPEVFKQAARWLPVPSYLLYRLTNQFAVDYTIAARTLVFDQHTLDWSAALLEAFNLPPSLFPPVYPGSSVVGSVSARAAEETGLQPTTLCALGGHDHLCATFAGGAQTSGAVTDSTGSANALLMLLPRFLPDPALGERGYASYAYLLKQLYVLKGGLKAAGNAVDWLVRQLSPGTSPTRYADLEALAGEGVGRRAGPLWLPHWIGSGTPEGDRFSRAALVGVQFEHNQGNLYRALLEGLAFWTRHNLEEMQALTGVRVDSLTLIGGVTRIRLLSQLKATVLNHPVSIPQIPESAATGAALLAGLGAGVFANPAEAAASPQYGRVQIDPQINQVNWYNSLYHQVYQPLYATLKPISETLEQINSGQD